MIGVLAVFHTVTPLFRYWWLLAVGFDELSMADTVAK